MEPKDFEKLNLNEQETQEIITPYAFKIHKPLLGLALAKPSQRGFALLIDVCILLLLSEFAEEYLWFLVAYGFFMAQRKGLSKRIEWLWRGPAKVVCVLVMLFAALTIFAEWLDKTTPSERDTQTVVASIGIETPSIKREDSSILSDGVERTKDLIGNFGNGLAWAAYFSLFMFLWNGQTPGKRLVGIRVVNLNGKPLSLVDCFGRYGGYAAGLATGFLGFLQVYWDPNRQAIQDKISNTVVIKRSERPIELGHIHDELKR
ncbi:hypothetical protein PALB_25110 [Pseudoalteromonas luteoviolacea B = ATCC 29581]|nr:hypothetical protein PALB_25110 [Pseudoalteromonas luteoviolacea B = ATCC 29581]